MQPIAAHTINGQQQQQPITD